MNMERVPRLVGRGIPDRTIRDIYAFVGEVRTTIGYLGFDGSSHYNNAHNVIRSADPEGALIRLQLIRRSAITLVFLPITLDQYLHGVGWSKDVDIIADGICRRLSAVMRETGGESALDSIRDVVGDAILDGFSKSNASEELKKVAIEPAERDALMMSLCIACRDMGNLIPEVKGFASHASARMTVWRNGDVLAFADGTGRFNIVTAWNGPERRK